MQIDDILQDIQKISGGAFGFRCKLLAIEAANYLTAYTDGKAAIFFAERLADAVVDDRAGAIVEIASMPFVGKTYLAKVSELIAWLGKPKGMVECSECDGDGEVTCTECERGGAVCTECDGDGYVTESSRFGKIGSFVIDIGLAAHYFRLTDRISPIQVKIPDKEAPIRFIGSSWMILMMGITGDAQVDSHFQGLTETAAIERAASVEV